MGGFERVRLAMAAVTIAVMASLLSLRSDAAQEVRVALVIANSDYANAPDLTNPVRDAAAVAEALGRAGFTMIERPAPNLSHAAMLAAINGFAFVSAATPSFWLGLMLIALFAVVLGWLPAE
jgi:hypothetical protein